MTSMPATCWSTTDCSAVASHRSPLRQGMITESHGVSIISSHHYSTVDRYKIPIHDIETPCHLVAWIGRLVSGAGRCRTRAPFLTLVPCRAVQGAASGD